MTWAPALALTIVQSAAPDAARALEDAGRYLEAEPILRRAIARPRDGAAARWQMRRSGVVAEDPARKAQARTLYRAAATDNFAAQGRHADYDRAASAELRSFAPIFTGQVAVSWTLASRA